MYMGYMQKVGHVIYGTGASIDFAIHGDAGTKAPQTLGDNCIDKSAIQ